eukprot:g11550.t1
MFKSIQSTKIFPFLLNGHTALYIACKRGHVEVVDALLKYDSIDINIATSDTGETSFYTACQRGHLQVVNALLKSDSIDINIATSDNDQTSFYVACKGGHVEVVNALLKHDSIDINKATSDNGETPLYVACKGGHIEIVNALLKHDSIDINKATIDNGETPLYVACKGVHIETVNALLKHDSIDVNKTTIDTGEMPLYIACEGGHIEIIDTLLKHDSIDVNQAKKLKKKKDGDVEEAIDKKNKVDDEEDDSSSTDDDWEDSTDEESNNGDKNKATIGNGETPLHAACSSKNWEILALAKMLLASGADCSIKNNNGTKPYGFNEDGTLNEGRFWDDTDVSRYERKTALDKFADTNSIKPETIKKAFKRFQAIDKDHSGMIDYTEFCEIMQVDPSPQCEKLFQMFDEEKAGQIDVREFMIGLSNFTGAGKEEKLKFAFMVFDEDGNGVITKQELIKILKANHMASSDKEVMRKAETIMAQADKDGDGVVSFDAFVMVSKKFPNILFPAYNNYPTHTSRYM